MPTCYLHHNNNTSHPSPVIQFVLLRWKTVHRPAREACQTSRVCLQAANIPTRRQFLSTTCGQRPAYIRSNHKITLHLVRIIYKHQQIFMQVVRVQAKIPRQRTPQIVKQTLESMSHGTTSISCAQLFCSQRIFLTNTTPYVFHSFLHCFLFRSKKPNRSLTHLDYAAL